MKNADYWRGRFSILEESAHQEADQYIQSLEEMFMDSGFETRTFPAVGAAFYETEPV